MMHLAHSATALQYARGANGFTQLRERALSFAALLLKTLMNQPRERDTCHSLIEQQEPILADES